MAVPGSASIKLGKIHAIAEEPFGHVERLAATVLAAPVASVHFAGERLSGRICAGALDIADRQRPIEQWLCQYVIDSGKGWSSMTSGSTRTPSRAARSSRGT